MNYQKIESKILTLAQELISIPAISVGAGQSLEEIIRCYHFLCDFFDQAGVPIIKYDSHGKIPALFCHLPRPNEKKREEVQADILFCGHYDRVAPSFPEQLVPQIDGQWLKGRGAADMLTAVATLAVFFKNMKQNIISVGENAPSFGLLLVGNEEPGEMWPWGTKHVLADMKKKYNYCPKILIASERTGDGEVKAGVLEWRNRGVMRFHIQTKGDSCHSGLIKGLTPIEKVLKVEREIRALLPLREFENWNSSMIISYLMAGETGNFNTMANQAEMGIEIRPIPETPTSEIIEYIDKRSKNLDIHVDIMNCEAGVSTSTNDKWLQMLLQTIASVAGGRPFDYLGSGKMPATQARFVPHGVAQCVWGQSGIGPHSANEAHYIPSIIPYYQMLENLASHDQ